MFKWFKSLFDPDRRKDQGRKSSRSHSLELRDSINSIPNGGKSKKCAKDGAVFGVALPHDLTVIGPTTFQAKNFINGIPIVVYTVIKYLLKRGLDSEGLFRIPCSHVELERIAEKYDKGEEVNYEDLKTSSSVNVPASVLKKYLRDLPEPLLTFESYETLKKAYASVKDPEQRLIRLRSVMDLLPPVNYDCLSLLSHFLKIVSEHSDKNKMTSVNLAICLAPSLIREEKEEESFCLLNSPNSTLIVKTLIDECDILFPGVSDPIFKDMRRCSKMSIGSAKHYSIITNTTDTIESSTDFTSIESHNRSSGFQHSQSRKDQKRH